jgi:hypothetical protein
MVKGIEPDQPDDLATEVFVPLASSVIGRLAGTCVPDAV